MAGIYRQLEVFSGRLEAKVDRIFNRLYELAEYLPDDPEALAACDGSILCQRRGARHMTGCMSGSKPACPCPQCSQRGIE